MTSTLARGAVCLAALLVVGCDDGGSDDPTVDAGSADTAPAPGPGLDDQTLDALYAAMAANTGAALEARLEAATDAVADACDTLIGPALGPAQALQDASPAATLAVACDGNPMWLGEVNQAIEAHDGAAWLVITLDGTCAVPVAHDDDVVIRVDDKRQVELRSLSQARAIIDASAWSAGRSEGSVFVEVVASEAIVIRSLEFTGISTGTEGADAGGIQVENSTRVVIDSNDISDVRVDYAALADPSEGNGFGIKVVGSPPGASSQVLVAYNTVTAMRTGQSENITIAGDVSAFAVVGNIVHDVDNIGIDLIGGESYAGTQARAGFICGNGMGDELVSNPAYLGDGDAAAAGVYMDGGGNDCVVAYNVVEGFSRGYEVGAEQANPTVLRTHLFGNISVAARSAGLLTGSLSERTNSDPTDRGTRVERHLIVANPSDDISSCVGDGDFSEDGAARCGPGSVERAEIEICLDEAVPADSAGCTWRTP